MNMNESFDWDIDRTIAELAANPTFEDMMDIMPESPIAAQYGPTITKTDEQYARIIADLTCNNTVSIPNRGN